MASYTETARNKLRALLGTSKVNEVDTGFAALAEDVDTKMLGWLEGTTAERPAASFPNRLFKATDTGHLWHDNGTEWQRVMVGNETVSTGSIGAFAYTPLAVEHGAIPHYPSATRPALVVIHRNGFMRAKLDELYIGTDPLLEATTTLFGGGLGYTPLSFIVPPGHFWSLGNYEPETCEASWLLL